MTNQVYNPPLLYKIIAWSLLIALVITPLFYFSQLPDQIPSHFNSKGEADAFSHKGTIWILPFIGVLLFLFLDFLSKSNIKNINIQKGVSPQEEAYRQFIGKQLLNAFKIIIPAAFLYINYKSIQQALGNSYGLGSYFLFIFLGVIFATIAYAQYKIIKFKKRTES